jgi:hypothetical protein
MKLIFRRCFWTPITKYDNDNGHVFKVFLDTIYYFSDVLQIVWVFNCNVGNEYITFLFYGCTYMVHKCDLVTSVISIVSHID